jgi:hypothetical protein
MLSTHFASLPDKREQGKCTFSQHDITINAFLCLYFQQPCFAEYQRQIGVENIPNENLQKEALDEIVSSLFTGVFKEIFSRLRKHKHVYSFAILPNTLLYVIDEHSIIVLIIFIVNTVFEKNLRKIKITYSHGVLHGVIMYPDKKQD